MPPERRGPRAYVNSELEKAKDDAAVFGSAVGGTIRVGAVAAWVVVIVLSVVVVAILLTVGDRLIELLDDIVS